VRHLAATIAITLALAPTAAAACPQTSLGDLEDEVMCPVCGTQLGIATEAPQAQRERAFIQRLIDECKSKDEIKTALVAEFGDEVLAEPGDDGFEIAAYLIPLAALMGAAAAIALGVSRWRRARSDGPSGSGAETSADTKRLDDDLARYDL
jgi:cytochrome c-type biogenesis protein CcmH/NrfF